MPFHRHVRISSEITTAKALWSHRAGPSTTVAVQGIHSYSCSKWDQPAYSLGSFHACSCGCSASTCSALSKVFLLHRYTRTKRVPDEVPWLLPSAQLRWAIQHPLGSTMWLSGSEVLPSRELGTRGHLFHYWFIVLYLSKLCCLLSVIILLFPV